MFSSGDSATGCCSRYAADATANTRGEGVRKSPIRSASLARGTMWGGGTKPGQREVRRIFARMDYNGNGILSLEETDKAVVCSTHFEGAVVIPFRALSCSHERSKPHYLRD